MSIDVGLVGREMTYSEYLTLPEDLNAELLDGRLHRRGHPSFEHDWAINELADLLRPLVSRPDRVFTGVGWKIDDRWGPGPDLAVISPVGQRGSYQGVPRLWWRSSAARTARTTST